MLSLKGGGTDGHGEAEGVTKLLVPYVLVLHFPPSNALSLRCHTKSLSLCFTISAGHTTAISSLCLTTITFLQNCMVYSMKSVAAVILDLLES